jgi:hypothetical protein
VKKALALVVFAAAIVGCKNVAPEADKAAVIVNPDAGSRAALQEAVNAALGSEVLLADDALTDSSILIIERQRARSLDGRIAEGRTMEVPVQFRLVTDGTKCILVDQRNLSRMLLANTSCIAE